MKIILTGPECSGKTTLALELAEYYGVAVATEPAREQLQPQRGYQPSDLLGLMQLQIRLEHHATAERTIFDTDLQNICLWWQEKFGPAPALLQRRYVEYCSQKDRIYLLCRPDIPWEYDPLRENPYDRDRLYALYRADLAARGLAYEVIEGQGDQRLKVALAYLQRLGV